MCIKITKCRKAKPANTDENKSEEMEIGGAEEVHGIL
jgi:hypothetical protein